MNPADVKMNHEPMSDFPNRVRVQPLLPLPNTTIPGKNRKKRRVVKIAIGDEIPLELNHCLDGVTTPAKPSGSDFNQGNNTTETGVAEEQQLYRKLDYPAVNINNNNAPSPLSSMLISDSKPAVSSVVSPNAGSSSADPATLKMQKGVSFLHEDNHHLDNTLPNSDESTEKDQTTAVNQKFLEREPAAVANLDMVLGAFQRGRRNQRQSLEINKPTSPSIDKKRPSLASMNTRQSSAGKQLSTMRLKEGYHHYRKPDTEVVEIGDEDYASMVPFIYDAAYPQDERDIDGNKLPSNISSFFSSVNGGFSGGVNKGINKAPSERSSARNRSATAKCLGVLTCSSVGKAVFGAGQDEAEKRDEMIAKAQTDEHDDELNYPLFYWVKNRDISQVKRVLKEFKRGTPVYVSIDGTSDGKEECILADKAEILKRDAAGATVLHIAYLFEEFEIARYLVEQYPSEALLPYDGDCVLFDSDTGKTRMVVEKKDMMYSGENILHIAIIKRNIPETRWLLEFYRDKEHAIPYGLIRLLTANAVGTFFRPIIKEESFYFGGFPLLFAVSCGNETMFDLVLAYASSIHHGEMEEKQEEVMFSKRIGANYDYCEEIVFGGKKKSKYVANGTRVDRWNECSPYTKWELKVAQYARKFLGRNVIFMRDIYGNNALHLCVLHKLQPMFVHVKAKAKRLLEIEIRDAYSTFLQYARTNQISPKRYEGKHIFILPTLAEDCFGYSPDESFLTMPIQSQYESGRWMEAVVAKKLEERFMMVLNEDLHSPLTLAAAMPDSRDPDNKDQSDTAKKKMLNFLLNELHSLRWQYGPVRRELVDLAGVEMQFDKQKYPRLKLMLEKGSKTPTMKGAITWLCDTKTDDCIMIEEVQRLIESKWHRCGYEIFRNAGITHLFMTLILTVLVCLVNATPHYNNDPSVDRLSRSSIQSQSVSNPLFNPTHANATISNSPLGNTRSSFLGIDQAVSVLYPIAIAQMTVMFLRDIWASIIYYVVDGNILYRSEEYTKFKKSHPFNEPEHDHVRGASGWKRTWTEWVFEWFNFVLLLPFTILDFFSADARGAAWFNLMSRYLITLSFGIHCIFKYIVGRDGDPDIYFGDDDTIRRFWHDDFVGHSGALHVFYRPVNDMRVLLPLVVCIIVAWIRSFFFLMGFDATGPFVLTINKIITGDVPFFFGFFFIIVLALACGICMLINSGDPSAYVGFYYLLKSFWVLLKLTFNNNIQSTAADFGLDVASVPRNDYILFDILYTLFFFMVMIMINLLIAIMSNTYDKFKKDSQSLLMMEKYNIMTYFEGAMLSKTEYREKYTIHKSDVKMPQGWKEYTGEKDVLDRWDIIRQMVATRKLTEMQSNNTSDHDNNKGKQKQRPSTMLSITSAVKASAEIVSSKPMMFKMDKGGKVTYDPAPSHLFHDAERSSGSSKDLLGNNKNTHRSPYSVLKNMSLGRSTFLMDPKDRPHLAYEFQKVGKDWFENDVAKRDDDTKPKVVLLIIDPQVDFHCNAIDHHPDNPADENGFGPYTEKTVRIKRGSLAVTGADEDSARIATMVNENLDTIDEIYVTMDTHHKLHMAHAISWKRGYFKKNSAERTVKGDSGLYKEGDHPEVFTAITHQDVVDGVWVPGPHLDAAWCQEYTKKLEIGGKFKLMIWPEHCLIGTPGHAVVPVISEALTKWSKHHRKSVNYIRVGQNIRTEVYSVFKAEVEDPTEAKDPTLPGSTFNHNLMSKLKIADKLLVCGQALSHCVNFTFRDLVAHFDDMKKLYLLRDGCSCVKDCDDVGKQFVYDMEKLGVHVVNTDVVFRLILRKHVSSSSSSDSSSGINSSSVVNNLAANSSQNNVNLGNVALTRQNSSSFGARQNSGPPSDTTKLFSDIAALKTETEDLKRSILSLILKTSHKEADPTTFNSDNNNNNNNNNGVEEVSARYESRIFSLEKELKEARELLSKQQSH